MVGSYSSHGDAGGTLHLLSPTHLHHVDPASAFRQLRRSLSRSPSKTPTFRLVTSKSTSPTPASPLSPSHESQQALRTSPSSYPPSRRLSPSPLATPQLPGTRKPRAPSRRLSPMRNSPRTNVNVHSSPRKRTLNESANSGNVTPRSSAGSSDDQENISLGSGSPTKQPFASGLLKASAPPLQSSPFLPPRGTTRFEKGYGSWGAKSSPLKRSDGIMNFDQGNGRSPSAKRRSLHGGIFGPDFDIFDHEPPMEGQDTPMLGSDCSSENVSLPERLSPRPKRTSSLRKTTLQQRYDKPVFAKMKPNLDVGLEAMTPATSKTRARMSLDSVIPTIPRDSPFSSQGSLPNASVHPLSQHPVKHIGTATMPYPQRHPLSRTISQSTSNSSMAEDSPTHVPVRLPDNRRPLADFSKSLPVGANRTSSQDDSSSTQQSGTSFATPESYRLIKPLPAAFMSTGLISKRHKNPEDNQSTLNASTSTMPDTPCKRHSLAEASSPTAPPQEVFAKSHQMRHSFGTPSTPFNPHAVRPSLETFGKGTSIFGQSFGSSQLQRRASFIAHDPKDNFQSPPGHEDSQSSAESEIPPTPTKQALVPEASLPISSSGVKAQNGFVSPNAKMPLVAAAWTSDGSQNSKSISHSTQMKGGNRFGERSSSNTLSTSLKSKGFFPAPRSFSNSRLLHNAKPPAPLTESCLSIPSKIASSKAKSFSPISASPITSHLQHRSPHTPRENMLPPDPSGLSISAHAGQQIAPANPVSGGVSSYPPATPTAPRGSLASFAKSNASVTPSHTPAAVEVDPTLTARFDKVEMIGTGEFSQVFRVSKAQELRHAHSYFSMPTTRSSPKTPLPDKVWAVKKTRHAYIGPKDRQRKLQEVNTLRALGQSDHTLELHDSWEDKNHLYIQTEFCEEGSLDGFLDQVGRQARLDDFRIWKILLEMSLVSRISKSAWSFHKLTLQRVSNTYMTPGSSTWT